MEIKLLFVIPLSFRYGETDIRNALILLPRQEDELLDHTSKVKTTRMTPEESTLLAEFGFQLYYQIAALICTCTFFGFYLLATHIAFHLLYRRGIKSVASKTLLGCLILIFINYIWVFIVKCAANMVDIKVSLTQNQSGGDLGAQLDNAGVALLPYQYTIAWPVTLNLIISDCIVTWRAWVVWTGNTQLRLCLAIFAFASFVVNIIDCVFDDIALKSFWAISAWDTAAAFLSFGLNLIATLLIAFKVWQHHQVVKTWANHQRTEVEKVLLLFVESGALYCLFQLVYSIMILLSASSSGGTTSLMIATSIIIECFIFASALFPVSIIIMINLEWSPLEYTIRQSDEEAGTRRGDISTLQFARDTRVEDLSMQAKPSQSQVPSETEV
ncbi:hypothetical protein F5878DRAFT_184405 [Lentinula raphanica]|uniref:Uncharacterized protein n=1 Tax=Lentinula raphanica TaxID=153919 RepID=A0AA38P8Q8_9AGAR|nr:hypothetical protein F5880DRAFT_606407 [Lentinula raphanica]KAJ3838116.1 hypothetical protein F5878DRAFT_184405 [Lentinula raphanica]